MSITKINKNKAVVSEDKAKEAVKTLIEWIGENPDRDGIVDTPERVINSFKEYFSGYNKDPRKELQKTFTEISGYSDVVLLKNIVFNSHCEHHLAPISGVVHIAYYPKNRVVGISKLGRVVDILSKRLQIQERLTEDIANIIYETLEPNGVAVYITAKHSCMQDRGIYQRNSNMNTYSLLGCFRDSSIISQRFFDMIKLAD